MKLNAIIFWILAAISIVAGSQNVVANTTKLSLKAEVNPKVCGSDTEKEFIIFAEMGNVVATDSLYGFDFQLIYDSNNLIFTDLLTKGCLAEKCTYKNIAIHGDTVRGYATRMDFKALVGDKPLFALKGQVKNNCVDSALIKIDFIDFTEEFTKVVDIEEKFYLKVDRISSKQNKLSAAFEVDTLEVYSDSEDNKNSIKLTYNGSEMLDNFKLRLIGVNINKVLTLSGLPSGYEIEKKDSNEILIAYKGTKSFALSDEIGFSISKEYIDSNENAVIEVKSEFVEEKCKCIGKYDNDTLTIIKAKSSVSDYRTILSHNAMSVNDNLHVGDNIKYLKLYNTLGNLLAEREVLAGDISFGMYENGYYLALLLDDNHRLIKTIKIIKYSFIN